ncbi:MAG: SIS domain-containing protein [Sandaracinaceae bacterium]
MWSELTQANEWEAIEQRWRSRPFDAVVRGRSHLMELARIAEEAAKVLPELVALAGLETARRLRRGGKVLVCGNGGSAADAAHLAGELVGRMGRERRSLPAVALTADAAIVTCIGNDYGFDQVFARQVEGLGQPDDVLVGITTSGTSKNVLAALDVGREKGLATVVLTGRGGDPSLEAADHLIRVPSGDTARVQEIHTALLHAYCDVVERTLFGEEK